MKVISKKYWQDMKKRIWTNFNKIRSFFVNRDEFATILCCRQAH